MVIKFQKSAIKATSFHLNFSIASLLWLCIAAATVLSVHRQISSLFESMETKKQKNENLWKNGEQTQLYSPYKRENVAVPRPTMFAEISIFSSSSTLWKFSFKHKKTFQERKLMYVKVEGFLSTVVPYSSLLTPSLRRFHMCSFFFSFRTNFCNKFLSY